MPTITTIIAAAALVVIIAEFYITFRRQAERRIIEKLQNTEEGE